jgi:hypothetical protein
MRFTGRVRRELFFEAMILVYGISAAALLYRDNILVSILMFIGLLLGVKFWYKRHDVYFFAAGAIVGPFIEIICIYFGVWQYANPTFLGIPLWLPFAWGLFTMLVKRIAETFVTIETRSK